MASLFLSRLTPEQRSDLIRRLHESQHGSCFICEQPIDLELHAGTIDVDHVEPTSTGGRDDESNFALAHASCNRSKQASDLRVARVLARFDKIRTHCVSEGRSPDLSDVLREYGGAKHDLVFQISDGSVRYTLSAEGDNAVNTVPLFEDDLSSSPDFRSRTYTTTSASILAPSAAV